MTVELEKLIFKIYYEHLVSLRNAEMAWYEAKKKLSETPIISGVGYDNSGASNSGYSKKAKYQSLQDREASLEDDKNKYIRIVRDIDRLFGIKKKLNYLTDSEREIVELVYFKGVTFRELATVLEFKSTSQASGRVDEILKKTMEVM